MVRNGRIKRFLVGLLALVVILTSVLPMGNGIFDFGMERVYGEEITSGDWTYRVMEDGTAEITGYNGDETELAIPSEIDGYSVTGIGEGAFYECSNLTNITIPEGVISIGSYAFQYCYNLTDVTVPKGIRCIQESTFEGCKNLINITIPDSVTDIEECAFAGCSSLSNITIPKGVISIGVYAFADCGALNSIIVDENNTVYDSRDNCNAIINTSNEKLILGCMNTVIPKEITSIGSGAFAGCNRLTEIIIPDGVTDIKGGAFSGCSNLINVTIPEGVTNIWWNTFYGCSSLTDITIPDSVKSISEYAFYGCNSLTDITIPNSVTNIGENVFCGCKALSSIVVDENNTIYDSRNNCNAIIETSTGVLMQGCMNTVIPEGVTEIKSDAFYKCDKLIDIAIPDSVTYIGESAFRDCYGLTCIVIPNGVKEIGSYAFECCENLTSITIASSVQSMGEDIFIGCENITIMSARDCRASEYASEYGLAWKEIMCLLPSIEKEYYIYDGTEKEPEVTVKYGSEVLVEGVDYSVVYSDNVDIGTAIIEVTGIGAYENEDKVILTFDIIESEEILDYCFTILDDGTIEITEYIGDGSNITIPEQIKGYKVTSIGFCAFEYCDNLVSVVIPNGVNKIGLWAFNYCVNLEKISIPNSVTKIESAAFRRCEKLYDIQLPESLTDICDYAFTCCYNLPSITIPAAVKNIEEYAFVNCSNLENINVSEENDVYSSLDGVLYNKSYTKLQAYPAGKTGKCQIKEGITTIGAGAFDGCSGLTEIVIPNGVTEIGAGAFDGCSGLTEIKLPEGITEIGINVFFGCDRLTQIEIPKTVVSIGETAFGDCINLRSITIPQNVVYIDKYAFNYTNFCTIYSTADAYAHTYAIENGIPWKEIAGEKISLTNASVIIDKASYTYDGKPKQPSVTVKHGNTTLVEGADYTVTYVNNVNLGTATVTIKGIGNYTGTVNKTFTINAVTKPTEKPSDQQNAQPATKLAKVSSLKQKSSYSTSAIPLNWKKVDDATGYEVYRATSKNGKYTKVKTTTSTSFKNTKLKAGKTYYYKVRAYKLVNGTKTYGDYSSVAVMGTKTVKPNIKVTVGKKQVKITWKKVTGANGYEVYMSTDKAGKYEKIKTATAKTTSFTKKKLTSGKKYYFKIRTYRKVNGKKIYSGWSSVKSVKIK